MEKRGLIIIAIVGLFILGLFYYIFVGKTCNDEACFDKAARECRPASYVKNNNGNIFKYEISYSLGNNCNLDINVEEIGSNTPEDIARLFEGKNMRCSIPKEVFNSEFLKLSSALDYCHGTLKEAMYELMLQRLYDLAVNQMGDVVMQADKVLQGEK